MINREKSRLSPAQDVVFLGLALDSVTFTERLPVEQVEGFRACLTLFRLGRTVQFSLCLRLLGLMALAILGVRLGRLHVREFQFWVAACRLDPVCHGARRVRVMPECNMALHH